MVESMPSETGPLSPDFAGIDPDLMQGFVTALERGRDVIGEQSERIRQLLATAETSATALRPIREIEGWIGDELPGLRKRLQTINQDLPMIGGAIGTPEQVSAWTGDWLQDPISWGLLAYDEKTGKTSATNAKEGAKLAARFKRLPSSPLGLPDTDYDRILDKLAGKRGDAYFTAGFFRILGPEDVLTMIHRLTRYGEKANGEHRRVISGALATALRAQPGVLGSAWKADNLRKASENSLASLLQYGTFPTPWLTEIMRGRTGEPIGDGDGSRPRRWKTDLIPFLPVLANNPEMTRGLFDTLSREDLRDLFTELNRTKSLEPASRYPSVDFDVSAEFGRMLASIGGAYEKGPHSPEAAKYAFNVMTIMGDLRDVDGTDDSPGTPMEVAPGARIFMSELAGAYATELVEGANIGDANMTEASTLKPFTSAFGTTSAFTLSPKDTYRFLKTFADSDKNLAPFEKGMGALALKLIADASATTRSTGDVKRMDQVFTALGNLRGFELAAIEKVQGNLDSIDKKRQSMVKYFRDNGIGVLSLYFSPIRAADYAWFLLSASISTKETVQEVFGEEDETRVDRADKRDAMETLGRQHTYAQLLMANGFAPKVTPAEWQAKCPPGVAITDAKGNLKPFADLIKQGNRGLESFERWVAANGMGGTNKIALGTLSNDTASWFEGGNKRGRERGLAFDS